MFSQPWESGKLIAVNTLSTQEWPGLHSMKFTGTRRYLKPQDQLNGYEGAPLPPLGRKHYEQKYSEIGEYKPHLKVFPNVDQKSQHLSLLNGRLDLKNYIRSRRNQVDLKTTHTGLRRSTMAINARLINTSQNNNSNQKRGLTIYIPNAIPLVRSLGDKPYRHPEYAQDFYKQGGLIAGSTTSDNRQKVISERHLSNARVAGKMTWKERERLEETREELRQVNELDFWEQNTLREANPNWKDPEKFFDNEDNNAKVQGNNPALKKDNKKQNKK